MMLKRAGMEKECGFEEIVRIEMDEVPELLAAHERGFLNAAGDSKSCYSSIDGSPLLVAKHEQGWPMRRLVNNLDLRDFYFGSYVFRSLYHDQVHRWLRLFLRQQLMIVRSESLFENAADTMSEVAEFLGLESFEFRTADQLQRSWDAGESNPIERPQDYAAMEDATRHLLADFFEPYNQQLYRLIDEDFGWN